MSDAATSIAHTKLLLNGELIDGEGKAETIYNPATGTVLATIPEASPEQLEGAIRAANKAFPSWSLMTVGQRSVLLLKLADRIEAQSSTFARRESLNCGKPYKSMLTEEM